MSWLEKMPMKSALGQCKATTRSCTRSILSSNKSDSMKTTKSRRKVKVDPSCLEIQAMNSPSDNSNPLEAQSQQVCQKIKLQLFPFDETTKKGLEEDNHNPYLELTLATRKKISSVVKHLNIKWGSSKPTTGELLLFPFETSLNNIIGSRKWTLENSNVSAADVHASLGSPKNFRLRYVWSSYLEEKLGFLPASNTFGDDRQPEVSISLDIMDGNKLQIPLSNNEKAPTCIDMFFSDAEKSGGNKDEPAAEDANLSWDDGISNISFGAFMSELSQTLNAGDFYTWPAQKNSTNQPFPNACDSFDADIASFFARQRPIIQQMKPPPSSIWEAEETCDAFPFASNSLPSRESEYLLGDASLNQSEEIDIINPVALPDTVCPQQELTPMHETFRPSSLNSGLQTGNNGAETITNAQIKCQDDPSEELKAALAIQPEANDYGRIALGETSSTIERYHAPCSGEMSGGDNDILGLDWLVASSMDAFQNFSII